MVASSVGPGLKSLTMKIVKNLPGHHSVPNSVWD